MKLFAKWDPKLGDKEFPPPGLPRGMIFIGEDEALAKAMNVSGCGIFWAVNELDWSKVSQYSGRTIENVKEIKYWCAEIDDRSFEEQEKAIKSFVSPTFVIQSKRSYHVYWRALDGSLKNYSTIQSAIIKLFKSDPALKHPAIVLRPPGFFHMKDPENPFLLKKVFESTAVYRERTIVSILEGRLGVKLFETKKEKQKQFTRVHGSTFFEKLDSMDQGEILSRLSGLLSGDTIGFRKGSRGRKNIWVNGKSTAAFIDERGKIGSPQGGGPTAVQWITYYGYSVKDAIEILKREIPELRGEER